jgi:ubiquinone/menaquinone biosynthesis C-methylase UbiE
MPLRWFTRRSRRESRPLAVQRGRRESGPARAVMLAGRRHLQGVPYALPKDLEEVNRLDFQHYLLRQVLRGNHLAPIEAPRAILDVGSGTGCWCRDLAAQFPAAQVYGVDLEQVKTSGPVPLPYHFLRANVLEGLPFAEGTFDFVHQRLLVAAIPAANWPGVLAELYRVTRPGGWIELVECGVEGQNLGPLTQQFFAWGLEAGQARGLDARIVPTLGQLLLATGARNLGTKAIEIPLGEWGGRIGKMMKQDLLSALAGLKALYTQRGATGEDFETLLQELPGEWEHFQSTLRFFIFYGQK